MTSRFRKPIVAVGFALTALAAGYSASGKPPAADEEIVPCRDDAAKMCWEEKPGRAVLKCLKKHTSELSEACRAALSKPRK